MASISKDPNGNVCVQFVGGDQRRRSIRLGKITSKTANEIKLKVEHLNALAVAKLPMDAETARWVAGIGDDLAKKLAAVGLIPPRQTARAGVFLAAWLADKEAAGFKPTSIVAWGQTVAELTTMFAPRPLATLTHADGEAFRDRLKGRGLRPTTVHKRLTHAKGMLEDAVRLGHLTANPFRHVRQRPGDPSERRAYVPVSDTVVVIDHCPNVWWRLLVALARFGGLRTPSEPFSLTWGDVDWERNRLSVASPKTEHAGKAHRVIPLFPLLRPHLEAAFDAAEEGTTYIFPEEYRRRGMGKRGWNGANLRTTFGKVIRRAKVEPWPRLWHSLRASCESDLAQSFPLAVVAKWLGNTPSMALRHYVDPTDAAFVAAANWTPGAAPALQKAVQSTADPDGLAQTQERGEAEKSAICPPQPVLVCSDLDIRMDPPGIEPGLPPCHSGVIPLDHRPEVEWNRGELHPDLPRARRASSCWTTIPWGRNKEQVRRNKWSRPASFLFLDTCSLSLPE